MKLYAAKSRTPKLDISVIILIATIYLCGFAEFLLKSMFGVSMDTKLVDVDFSVFVIPFLFLIFLMAISTLVGLLLTRYVASKLFGIKTGDGYIEIDTKTNTTKIVMSGEEDPTK